MKLSFNQEIEYLSFKIRFQQETELTKEIQNIYKNDYEKYKKIKEFIQEPIKLNFLSSARRFLPLVSAVDYAEQLNTQALEALIDLFEKSNTYDDKKRVNFIVEKVVNGKAFIYPNNIQELLTQVLRIPQETVDLMKEKYEYSALKDLVISYFEKQKNVLTVYITGKYLIVLLS